MVSCMLEVDILLWRTQLSVKSIHSPTGRKASRKPTKIRPLLCQAKALSIYTQARTVLLFHEKQEALKLR